MADGLGLNKNPFDDLISTRKDLSFLDYILAGGDNQRNDIEKWNREKRLNNTPVQKQSKNIFTQPVISTGSQAPINNNDIANLFANVNPSGLSDSNEANTLSIDEITALATQPTYANEYGVNPSDYAKQPTYPSENQIASTAVVPPVITETTGQKANDTRAQAIANLQKQLGPKATEAMPNDFFISSDNIRPQSQTETSLKAPPVTHAQRLAMLEPEYANDQDFGITY